MKGGLVGGGNSCRRKNDLDEKRGEKFFSVEGDGSLPEEKANPREREPKLCKRESSAEGGGGNRVSHLRRVTGGNMV